MVSTNWTVVASGPHLETIGHKNYEGAETKEKYPEASSACLRDKLQKQ